MSISLFVCIWQVCVQFTLKLIGCRLTNESLSQPVGPGHTVASYAAWCRKCIRLQAPFSVSRSRHCSIGLSRHLSIYLTISLSLHLSGISPSICYHQFNWSLHAADIYMQDNKYSHGIPYIKDYVSSIIAQPILGADDNVMGKRLYNDNLLQLPDNTLCKFQRSTLLFPVTQVQLNSTGLVANLHSRIAMSR